MPSNEIRVLADYAQRSTLDPPLTRPDRSTLRISQHCSLGASASPLLANVYLHYVLDLWVTWWRRHQARGDVIICRFADDFIAGFEHEQEALRFLTDLRGRLARFGLEVHPDKTRLIEFGRHAARNRSARGLGKPETFDFLGFTHLREEQKRRLRVASLYDLEAVAGQAPRG